MKNRLFINSIFILFVSHVTAQNTTFDNVAIGIGYPTYGVKIKTNFPGYTGGWGRAYFITNETGDQSFFTFGSNGNSVNGISSVTSSYIGKDLENRYMTFLPDGNIGIGTNNPSSRLSILGGISKLTLAGIDGTFDNLIKYGHKSDLENQNSDSNRWHGIDATITAGSAADNKLKFRLYGGGFSNLAPVDVMTIVGNGNVGIGTVSPAQKLDVNGNINMAGVAGRRIFMGGIGGTTFGLAYDSGSPDYGIFYTEAATDYVSISPNGNATNGVVNVFGNGNVGIGTTNPTSKLTVAGNINSREVKVTVDAGADFVFDKEYDLPSLTAVEKYINENKHLPEIASAAAMQKDGINLSEMNIKLLQKIEELTLYMIQQNKNMDVMQKENLNLEKRLNLLEQKNK